MENKGDDRGMNLKTMLHEWIMCDLKYMNLETVTKEEFKIIEDEQVLIWNKKSYLSLSQRVRILWIYEEIWREF